MDKVLLSDYLSKKFNPIYMTKTLIKKRYEPRYKLKPQNQPSKHNTFEILPPNLQSFKHEILSRNGFMTYK